ncbi:hypothetical protein EZS27_016650 [termite gut metagenome]|uniref:Uncharacterized protein n=1 Tax=termite gut metagenome TaxID=433724 RepID=A0A5J4RN56_9ZZZZ
MYTINFKGKPNPKDKKMVKLEMILFKTGYPRVEKILSITGQFKDWDQKTQSFKTQTSEALRKNKQLFDLKMKYLKVIEEWEEERHDWSPVQWSHCFDKAKKEKEKIKVLSVSQMISLLTAKFKQQERYKNGRIVTSEGTAQNYIYLENSLGEFTQKKIWKKSFILLF